MIYKRTNSFKSFRQGHVHLQVDSQKVTSLLWVLQGRGWGGSAKAVGAAAHVDLLCSGQYFGCL